ncbi:MAG TPA: DUF2721 domain-containing protein [Lacipirellulaceae bacterium]
MLLKDLLPDLQIAIGPVILISGVGLLLLSMTNRLGRTIDRSRQLVDAKRGAADDERQRFDAQLAILWRRARLQRAAIILAAAAALLASTLIIVLFIGALLSLQVVFPIIALFVSCMVAIIASLLCFMRDIDLALHALALELIIQQRPTR